MDIAPPDPAADPVVDARAIAGELKKFSPELATRERWLVLNKIDLLPPAEAEKRCKEIVRRLRWKGPVYRISGVTQQGTQQLCFDIMRRLEEIRLSGVELPDAQLDPSVAARRGRASAPCVRRLFAAKKKKPALSRLFRIDQAAARRRNGRCLTWRRRPGP